MILKAENISLSYGATPVLDRFSTAVAAGERVLVLGPSGCGKTSLLSILAGLSAPNEGNVLLDGVDFLSLPPRRRDAMRGKNFGFVFQTLHLLPALTLRRNIELAASLSGNAVDAGRVDALLNRLGLGDKADRRPDSLSHGEAQRGAIARAVVHGPKIIIADEPTSALDDDNARRVIDLLTREAELSGAALIVATHDSRIKNAFARTITLNPSIRMAA